MPGLGDTPALKVASARAAGAPAAILGYPRNGPYDARPARLAATDEVISQDAYGRGPVPRQILAPAVEVQQCA